MKKTIKNFLNQLPYIKGLYQDKVKYTSNSCYPPGHYYSPICDIAEIKEKESAIWHSINVDGIKGIDLNVNEQIRLVEKEFVKFYKELPFEGVRMNGLRYGFENEMYSYTDGIFLYSMMRHFKPTRIIAVASGHSSALMLDVNQIFFENKIELTFIEPYPERLYNTIREEDKRTTNIIVKNVQEVKTSLFETLEKGDILFIDSTHVSKCGSDVNFLLFDVLPILQKGVLIHFHDIFYPFEYPKGWVYQGRNWNENYILRAFLMHNKEYTIKLFSHYLHKHHTTIFKQMPLTYHNFGGCIWLEKS